MKKWLLFILIPLIVFLIYEINIDNRISVLNISDITLPYPEFVTKSCQQKNRLKEYNNFFSKSDYRITDFYLDIENNREVLIKDKKQSLKNALIRYDIIMISIGNTDFLNKSKIYSINEMYNYIDETIVDYDKLFLKIRSITKEHIIIYGYNFAKVNQDVLNYYNTRLKELCEKYEITFIANDKNTNQVLEKQLNTWLDK